MADILRAHLDRVKAATVGKLGRKDLPKWIEKNTFINGKPFSFKGHEYQHSILLDESEELVVRKSAQTGISEMAMRMALGLVMVMPGAFRIGYTFPSASFAASSLCPLRESLRRAWDRVPVSSARRPAWSRRRASCGRPAR